jgi:uncharacterized glyoxalase superfamily protein PhnB
MGFVATADGDRARSFYGGVLGLPLVSDDDFATVFLVAGTLLRVQKVPGHAPLPYTALGWQVADLSSSVTSLAERGVRFERFAGMPQDELDIWTSPSGAKVAWFKDPDGNVLSLTEDGALDALAHRDTVVPEIFVDDGVRALAFYCEAFGAVERSRMMAPDGRRLMHGELSIAGHRIFVVDEFRDTGTCRCPKTLGGTGVRITLEVADVEAFVARAQAAGTTVAMPVSEMFWGARYAKLIDPFGHEWGINEQRQILSAGQEAANARQFFGTSG